MTVYFVDSAPSSLQLLPLAKNHPAECVMYGTVMLCDVAVWNPSDASTPCQCGQLMEGQSLGLTDASVPSVAGKMEIVQLLQMPPAEIELGELSIVPLPSNTVIQWRLYLK